MKKFLIFEKRFASLKQEVGIGKKHFLAIPRQHVLIGVVVPRNDLSLLPDAVGEVEARTPEEALAIFEERRANAIW